MNSADLVTWLRAFHAQQCRHDPALQVEDRTIGDALVTIDPHRQTPFPSSNRNLAAFIGHEEPATSAIITAIKDRFAAAGVTRYFVWLSPGPRMQATSDLLIQAGFTRFGGTSYPKLVRDLTRPIETRPSAFSVRRVVPTDKTLAAALPPDASRTLAVPGYDHFVALDGQSVIARAFCYTSHGVTYLGGAHTDQAYRNQGAQSALIAARLNRGKELGSTIAISETLAMLETSLVNLQRGGFRVAYDEAVFQSP